MGSEMCIRDRAEGEAEGKGENWFENHFHSFSFNQNHFKVTDEIF